MSSVVTDVGPRALTSLYFGNTTLSEQLGYSGAGLCVNNRLVVACWRTSSEPQNSVAPVELKADTH
jgi:hypothetical protein